MLLVPGNNITHMARERTSIAIEPDLREWLKALSDRSGFSMSSLVSLSLRRMQSEPAIFVPISLNSTHTGVPRDSRRRKKARTPR